VADRSAIQWTAATWNPTTGCDRISAGCGNCYALALSRRLKAMGQPKYQNDGDPRTSGPGFAVTVHPDALSIPNSWREPRLVFVDSMSDLFHARVPRGFVHDVFEVMAGTPRHTYQILTKRSRRLSQDELIEQILLPLFRQLGFQRITAAGHKDKALDLRPRDQPARAGRSALRT
jgi:protein gp37